MAHLKGIFLGKYYDISPYNAENTTYSLSSYLFPTGTPVAWFYAKLDSNSYLQILIGDLNEVMGHTYEEAKQNFTLGFKTIVRDGTHKEKGWGAFLYSIFAIV